MGREDFEFSKLLMKVGMAKGDSKRLIKIIRRGLDGNGSFNITNSRTFGVYGSARSLNSQDLVRFYRKV